MAMTESCGNWLLPEERIERLERQVRELNGRVATLERPRGASAPPALGPVPERPPGVDPRRSKHRPKPPLAERFVLRDREAMEDLLGGRVLAWVGGLAVLLGIAFLFAVAASRGWIGEGARTGLAALASTGLLVLGVWLHERKARTDAALAAVASGVAGLFVTITVAAQVYELIPDPAAIGLAFATGAAAAGLAVRWESRGIAALGIVGALVAPVLAGAEPSAGTVAILFVALASAAGVLLWLRWDWLALAAFGLSAPQWVVYLFWGAGPAEVLVTLVAFGMLGMVVAAGHDLRVRSESLRSSSAFLLALNALAVATAGWFALGWIGEPAMAKAWLAGMALAHVAFGLAGPRLARVSRDLGLLSLVLGVVLADVAFGLIADGAVLAIGWAASGVGFAGLLHRGTREDRDETLIGAGLGGHVALALVYTLTVDAPPADAVGGGVLSAAGAASVVALAAGCLVSARLVRSERPEWRILLDGLGLAALAYLTALALDGEALALAWAVEAATLAVLAHRAAMDPVAGWGALGFLGLAAGHALAFEAPPEALVTGLSEPLVALAALGTLTGATLLAADRLRALQSRLRPVLLSAAAVTLLYLASVLVVTPFESGKAVDSAVLSAHQQGQMVLSVFWSLVGVATIVIGLRRDLHALRVAGLALLGVTVAKVFLTDLATLSSMYRVVSFLGLGLLLLAGAFVWQRLRPRALPDLREVPEGIR
jgi:uncharacterized membrane protein